MYYSFQRSNTNREIFDGADDEFVSWSLCSCPLYQIFLRIPIPTKHHIVSTIMPTFRTMKNMVAVA